MVVQWHGPLIPRDVLDHRGKWVAIDSHVQPPRILLVRDTREEIVGWLRDNHVTAAVMRVPVEDEPELVGAG